MDGACVEHWPSPEVPAGMATTAGTLMSLFAKSTPRSPLNRDRPRDPDREGDSEVSTSGSAQVARTRHLKVSQTETAGSATAGALLGISGGQWCTATGPGAVGLMGPVARAASTAAAPSTL
jgi:hypothetical protein